ncbi:MAG TPA: glycosyltransferase family 1 protein [Candidatus Dormibacteraeota bacterium]|nr:glycosyltransferase family 1 protein [Candidatus Dormibacteraeota bacterium]
MKPPQQPILGIDASRVSTARAGIDNYVHHLLPGLVRAWRAQGGEVVVFSANPAVAAHVEPPVRVLHGGGRGWTQGRLPGAARRAALDVYFSPIPVLPVLLPMPCASVVTVQDLLEFRPRWWYFRRLIGRALQRSTAVVCISQATEQEVAAEFPEAAAKLIVVRLAADPEVFHEGAPEQLDADREAGRGLLARLGVMEAPILAVGTLQPRKNYARLIEAYARVSSTDVAPPPLLIVGQRGWDYEGIVALPRQLGIGDRVIFGGHLDDAEVAQLMRASMILAAVSTGEGFGLPVVEAMYSGLALLASDIPPFREVAGAAALFVNPLSVDDIAAGLSQLVSDPQRRQALVEVGRARRSLFSWDRASAEIAAALRRAVPATAPRRP